MSSIADALRSDLGTLTEPFASALRKDITRLTPATWSDTKVQKAYAVSAYILENVGNYIWDQREKNVLLDTANPQVLCAYLEQEWGFRWDGVAWS